MNFFALSVILAVMACSSTSFQLNSLDENINTDRVIGGATAKPGQLPYMVSLRTPVKTRYNTTVIGTFCGASIISNRWIVTAAHCIKFQTSKILVVVGAHHIRNDGQTYYLDRIVKHPKFDSVTLWNDISLLHTNETIQFNKFVRPIPLRRKFVDEGVVSILSGWGRMRFDPIVVPSHLQFLRVKTITNTDCYSRYDDIPKPYHKGIFNGTLCTLGERNGIGGCMGDSGGPLASNGQLIGLVSWGYPKPCASGRPDGFARISLFVDWIHEVSGVVAV